jgi:hypothetical protein
MEAVLLGEPEELGLPFLLLVELRDAVRALLALGRAVELEAPEGAAGALGEPVPALLPEPEALAVQVKLWLREAEGRALPEELLLPPPAAPPPALALGS